MKIGKVELKSNILLAPLAGYTDVGFRRLCADYGAGLTVTEMVSAKGLCYGNENTINLLRIAENESPVAVQLFGGEAEFLAKAVCHEALKKFDIIDINMGCPVNKIVKCGEGSALMKDTPRAVEIVQAAVENTLKPITVKIRAGFNEKNAPEFASAMAQAGASAITVHGRTREQFYSGEVDYDIIAEVKKAVNIPMFANGDIRTREDYEKVMAKTLCDGVVVGRGALGSPYIFAQMQDKPFDFDAKAAILQHIDDLCKYYPQKTVANLMKTHICFYAKNTERLKKIRSAVNESKSLSEILDVVENFF